jgi:hypothetical protein
VAIIEPPHPSERAHRMPAISRLFQSLSTPMLVRDRASVVSLSMPLGARPYFCQISCCFFGDLLVYYVA